MFVAIAMSLHERVLHVGGLALRWRIGGTNADRSAPAGRAWSAAALSAIYENGSAVKARLLCSAPPAVAHEGTNWDKRLTPAVPYDGGAAT